MTTQSLQGKLFGLGATLALAGLGLAIHGRLKENAKKDNEANEIGTLHDGSTPVFQRDFHFFVPVNIVRAGMVDIWVSRFADLAKMTGAEVLPGFGDRFTKNGKAQVRGSHIDVTFVRFTLRYTATAEELNEAGLRGTDMPKRLDPFNLLLTRIGTGETDEVNPNSLDLDKVNEFAAERDEVMQTRIEELAQIKAAEASERFENSTLGKLTKGPRRRWNARRKKQLPATEEDTDRAA